MKGNSDFSSIGVIISLVASLLGSEIKSITRNSGDEFSGSQVSQLAIINWHQAVTIALGSEKI